MHYVRLLSWAAGAAWAMEPVKAQTILGVVLARAFGETRADDTPWDDEKHKMRAAERRRSSEPQEGVAVLRFHGVISARIHEVQGVSTAGGVSSEGFAAALRQLGADPQVSGIVIDGDSPGGNVAGIAEAAAAIREVKAVKPVKFVANHWAASAAYWLASQADELIVTPSGEVGSIGVYVYHEDISKALEARGVSPSLIKAGAHKAEGHPAFPLGEEAREYFQGRVDAAYSSFVKDVAKGRGVSPETVRKTFGGGRMVGAQEAVRLGMADRIDTLEGVINRMQRDHARRKKFV